MKARHQEKLAVKMDGWAEEDSIECAWSRIEEIIVGATREAVGIENCAARPPDLGSTLTQANE